MKKSVLMLLINSFDPDIRVLREAEVLSEAGYRVTILAWKYKGLYKRNNYTHFEVIRLSPGLPRNFEKYSPLIKNLILFIYIILFYLSTLFFSLIREYDIYHAHDLNTLPIGVLLKIFKRKPLIYDSHEYYPALLELYGIIIKQLGKILERVLCHFVNHIITTNDLVKNEFKIYKKPVTIVSNYVDLKWFDSCNEQINIDKSSPIVLYQGILKKRRGLKELIKAKNLMESQAKFLFVGDGPLLKSLKAIRDSSIMATGKVSLSLIPSYIRCSDIGVNLLLPGFQNYYGTPNKLYEYMAGSIPVVVSDLPEMRRVVEEAGCGVVVDPRDPKDIARKISYLLNNEDIRREMGRRGRKLVEIKYNWQNHSENLRKVYEYVSN